jgi:hypothetical protein
MPRLIQTIPKAKPQLAIPATGLDQEASIKKPRSSSFDHETWIEEFGSKEGVATGCPWQPSQLSLYAIKQSR